MEPRIDPVTSRHGITSISGERRQREGSKQAFEEALDKQRKDAKDPNDPKDQKDHAPPDPQAGEDVVTLSHPNAPRPDAGLQPEPTKVRRDGEDDRPHVDVVV